MDKLTTYKGIERELARRKAAGITGSSWTWLAGKLGVSKQVVSNWGRDGVPAARHADIAKVFHWSIEAVLQGGQDGAPQPRLLPHTLELAQRLEALAEEDMRKYRTAYMHISAVLDRMEQGVDQPASPP